MRDRNVVQGLGSRLTILALLVCTTPGVAQHEEAPPPAAYALENVTIFHADGRREEGVNVVVRRGFILAMGAGAPIPAGAVILEGDSLRVYPGLIDAHGRAELDLPEPENLESVLPWAPTREAQGFTPHRLAARYLVGIGPDGRASRNAGVIAAGIHPDGGMAPGQGVAVIFRRDARTPWETVARPSLGLSFSFRGAQGVFPGTLFGVMAHFRQMFEDAGREGLILTEYGRSPAGLKLPKWDPDFETLRQAASGSLPVYFAANSSGDIHRVLGLSDEIGFRPIILGGEEAWKVSGELSTRAVPVLVSVDFADPSEWDPPKGDEGARVGSGPLEPGAAREKERLENAYANAGRLAGAGVRVALTSGGGGGDFREGVRKAIEYGLAESDALAAVTTEPASILGVPHMVTIAQGMAANFIVTDGPLFAEETGIRYTFVEGELERGREGRRGGTGEEPSVDVSGGWEVVVSAQGTQMPFTMVLEQDGAGFSGTMSSADTGEAQVTRGTVSGNELRFTLVFSMGTESMEVEMEAEVDGESMSGSGDGQMGSFTFKATRKPGPEGGIR